jgi:hypothetical protein
MAKAKRYCGMCDKWVAGRHRECPACGAATDPAMKAEPPAVVDLMECLKRALESVGKKP